MKKKIRNCFGPARLLKMLFIEGRVNPLLIGSAFNLRKSLLQSADYALISSNELERTIVSR